MQIKTTHLSPFSMSTVRGKVLLPSLPPREQQSTFTWKALELDHGEFTQHAVCRGRGVNDLVGSTQRRANGRAGLVGWWGNCQTDG